MMHSLYLSIYRSVLFALLCIPFVQGQQAYQEAQPSDENHVLVRSYQGRGLTNHSQVSQASDVNEMVTYYDGLGRPLQGVAVGQAPNGGDLVTPYQYDAYGRQVREWLPYPETDAATGTYRPYGHIGAQGYYHSAYSTDFPGLQPFEVNAYSEKALLPSPLGRPEKQAAPGKDWALDAGHEIRFRYSANTDGDAVPQFKVNLTPVTQNGVVYYEPTLVKEGTYPANSLYRNITADENVPEARPEEKLGTVEEYTDKQQRVVLKRTYVDMEAIVVNWDGDSDETNIGERPEMLNVVHDTHYVYDDFGNLTFVLSPKVEVANAITTTVLDQLCYQYRYDHRNRLVAKKLPGKGWEYIVYDMLDRPIMTQDPLQRSRDEWSFTKYDGLGRVVYTGLATDARGHTAVQSSADSYGRMANTLLWEDLGSFVNDGLDIGYNNNTYPNTTVSKVLTINYYDDYNFDRAGAGTTHTAFGITSSTSTQGLATGSKIRVLGTNQWITTVTHYDDKARPIHTYSNNAYLGTVDETESLLDFGGKADKVRTIHRRNDNTLVTLDQYTYDDTGRLLTHNQCLGEATLGADCSNATTVELIADNSYDALGQLQSKQVGNNLQQVDYRYNVRGWLTGINDNDPNHSGFLLYGDLWGFRIHYNTPHNYGYNQNPKALYNGNIAQVVWRTKSIN
ncbi:MAG: DUF6443 domain-containing protein, partial [Bacteroidota bacterium]